jgi:hypothetical protein
MTQSMIAGRGIGLERSIEVADEMGEIMLIVPFREATG